LIRRTEADCSGVGVPAEGFSIGTLCRFLVGFGIGTSAVPGEDDLSSNTGNAFLDLTCFLAEVLIIFVIGVSANGGDEDPGPNFGFLFDDLTSFLVASVEGFATVSNSAARDSISTELSSSSSEEESPSFPCIDFVDIVPGRILVLCFARRPSGRKSVKEAPVRLLAYPLLAEDRLSLLWSLPRRCPETRSSVTLAALIPISFSSSSSWSPVRSMVGVGISRAFGLAITGS